MAIFRNLTLDFFPSIIPTNKFLIIPSAGPKYGVDIFSNTFHVRLWGDKEACYLKTKNIIDIYFGNSLLSIINMIVTIMAMLINSNWWHKFKLYMVIETELFMFEYFFYQTTQVNFSWTCLL